MANYFPINPSPSCLPDSEQKQTETTPSVKTATSRMHPAIQLLFVTLLPYLALATVEYDRDGGYIIGAILPLTINGPDGKCSTLNPEGKDLI